ncbi:hypothetical protein V5799_011545 [Amblyomma americanum]|uniref:Uncharacterized protein n=1 Tax=Amblyomma americanum TaxID=6943 RepID=A0AAQ4EGV2_AMBAM
MAFVPLEGKRAHVKEMINCTLQRLAKMNSFFTSFVMLVFANFTTGEELEVELIEEGVIDPNMRMLLFYNGWDKSLGRWYYQHETRYPYEKLIYVITRAYIKETREIMKKTSANWGAPDHVFNFPDISTLVFLHYVLEYMSSRAHELPEAAGCGSPMDDFLQGMQQNVTDEAKRLTIHSSTASYRTFFMAPVTSKEYRLKHMETWKRNGTTFESAHLLNEVDAYLKNRTINMALLEDTDWVTFLDITEQRMGSFSMTDSLISHPVAILVQKPKILSRKMLFVQPFSTQVYCVR